MTVRDFGVGPELGRGPARLRPVLAGRPLPGAHRRRQRPRAVDQPRGRPPARRLAAGLGPARRRRPVPAHAAADRRRRPHQLAAAAAPGRRPPSRERRHEPRAGRAGAPLLALLLAVCRPARRCRAARRPCRSPRRPSRPSETVGIEPLPPEPGATPEEIVRGFIDAAASVRPGPPGGPRAPDARGRQDAGRTRPASPCSAPTTRRWPPRPGAVTLTANLVGTVDPRGVFTVGGTGRLHPPVHPRAGRRRVADHRPARRADHPASRTSSGSTSSGTPTSSTRPSSASCPIRGY